MEINTKEITEHLTLKSLFDGRGTDFHIRSMDRVSVDKLLETVKEIGLAWPANSIIVNLYDLSGAGHTITPYFRERAKELEELRLRNDVKVRNAVVMKQSYGVPMINLFLRTKATDLVAFRIFHKRDEALAWLKREIDRFDSGAK